MLTCARVIISPTEKLNFEFLQAAQWGNQNVKLYSSNNDAFFFDINEGKNASINKMAGFGISYSVLLSGHTYRFYGKAIGKDEAGNFPSCYASMTGLE
tara:strand:+ start:1035 stop:1328 length:294 start_codon:yes stop_codon:yes gene_type:complete